MRRFTSLSMSVVATSLLLTGTAQTLQAQANLSNAVALWNFDSLNDANGANSVLTIVDKPDGVLGTIGTGVLGNGFWANEGPGSDDVYANQRTGTDRVGTWFDAGQGAGNELQITGAHTMIWRGEFKDTSITGYLWSKYDHNVGPNAIKNRTAYLRYEPGGHLRYVVDDGDGGASSEEVFLSSEVTTGGNKYEIASVFDPANDTISIYGLNPKTRAVLFQGQNTNVTFNTIPMNLPVPFTMGDRVAWSGSDWESVGFSGTKVDSEMFAVFDAAFSLSDIQNMVVPEPSSIVLAVLGCWLVVRRRQS